MDLKTFIRKYAGCSVMLIEDMARDSQQAAIETLLHADGIPYGSMSYEAFGRCIKISDLTYRQAVLLIKAGSAMRKRCRERKQPELMGERHETS